MQAIRTNIRNNTLWRCPILMLIFIIVGVAIKALQIQVNAWGKPKAQ